MSVICQNFVQNAWKKDLCSNCFKSVGDHEISETITTKNEIQIQNQCENLRYVSQSSNVFPSQTNSTPHTTWKTLISEKNSKNTQPFKLETGFQGRLLTINKASHGIEKKIDSKTNLKNGQLSSFVKSSSSDDLTKTNGHSTKPNSVSHSKTNGHHPVQNGNGRHHTEDVKIVHNGARTTFYESNGKNERSSKPQRECQENGVSSKITEHERKTQSKLVKSRSEDTLSTPLHSILKKSVSSPANSPSRRGANVGFKDEEPLVIGYGGRDFSPEELEWDMNVSDVDNGSDSLDETEDDKAFSKMTRQNTEFNSDNTNLLQKSLANLDKNERKQQNKGEVTTKTSSQPPARQQKETDSSESAKTSDPSGKAPDLKLDGGPLHKTGVDEEGERNGDEEGFHSRNSPDMQTEGSIISNQIITSAIADNKDSVNVTIKSDKGSPMGEVGGAQESRVEDRNSSESVNEATNPPSRATNSSQNTDSTTATLEMFSDGEEQVGRNANTLPEEENNEWQDDDDGGGLAGQILQAINTSLTNRHKMNEEPVDPLLEIKTDAENSAEGTAKESPSSDINVVKCDVPVGKIESSDEEAVENGLSVEPRTSFLHGVSTNNRPTKPSAIYGPASDLFVSRSDSSSSSSSDEFSNKNDVLSHSINVIVNGESSVHQHNGHTSTDTETEEAVVKCSYANTHENNSLNTSKTKPEVPAKPSKPSAAKPQKKQFISKTKSAERKDSNSSDTQNGYYSVGNASTYSDDSKSISLVDHYAESNIYHEVDSAEMKLPEGNIADKSNPRESKLAALAMELEQVRHCNGNTKRQAPAPPKIPEPPLEDPPNCSGRTSPLSVDSPHGFASFRGEAMAFSSSSSTASTSSQDTETGYASWNIHGDMDDPRKHSKSKSSFLLTQYSKCKMLAMGYAEDSAKTRKKFSLKKLLKIRKDSEAPAAFDPNCPNPKAWKYSDHFERPRAKLEIIHPMDLENRNVTVNPGFDSLHSGSMSSFTASADDISLRNSVSSDYGSFYSDTISPVQDLRPEVNYEYIQQRHSITSEEQEDPGEANGRCDSNSPTPSRTSSVSQASTLTSGSSKNGGASPHRPPKPPPPPRAHSLLPGNKALNADGTFKFPVQNCHSVSNSDAPNPPIKPQAPKRQCKSTPQRTDYGIYDNAIVDPTHIEVEQSSEDRFSNENRISIDGNNTYGTIVDIRVNSFEKPGTETLESTRVSVSPEVLDQNQSDISQPTVQELKVESQSINVSVKVKSVPEPIEKVTKNVITRNKHSPITKAPARPPPIYMKSQISNVVKNPNPWKTLEDSYLVLTASNRELLIKLVNQALKKRKNYVSQLQKVEFQWSDFEIDVDQPSSVFAFGEKIAYHATMPKYPEYAITLVVTVQQQHNRLNENGDLKYPVFGQFVDYIPKELLEENYSSDTELESMQATVLVLDRSNISTIECFSENLPSSLTEENEKELCFIILQLIHSLKSLQAHGIESIDSSFQNLILAKSKQDKYNSLVFLSDSCYDENDYMSDSCKISLCQYALMLLFQMLGIQSAEEFFLPPAGKFSSETSKKVFETAVSLLSEEKAVSLSQTKTLFECFLWEVTSVMQKLDASDDMDSVLHRWLDIKRSNYIKNMIDDESLCDINIQSEYFSQFLIRTSVRNIKEVVSYL